MRTRDVAVALCLLAGPSFAAEEIQFSESEIRAILAHGPWPAPATTDPSNRASGRRALKLTAAEQTDLVVFLESVSTLSNPWRPEDHGRCQ